MWGERLSGKMYKGHMDKANGDRIKDGRWGCLRWGGVVGRKWRQLYLNNNKKRLQKKTRRALGTSRTTLNDPTSKS